MLALRVHPQLAKVMSFFVAANCYLLQSWQSLLSLAIERALNRGADELLSCSHQQRLIKECHQLSFSHLSIFAILVVKFNGNNKKCFLQNQYFYDTFQAMNIIHRVGVTFKTSMVNCEQYQQRCFFSNKAVTFFNQTSQDPPSVT